MQSFLSSQGCKNILKNKTCFKSLEGSCNDFILTSMLNLHQQTQVFESRMSNQHMMIYTMLKSTYTKLEPTVLSKQQYKNFSKKSFLKDLRI